MNWWSDFIWLLGAALSVLHLLGLLAALHALLTVRTAQGSVAWVVSLLLLPELTLLPYLIFGRSRFAGYIAARRQENGQMQRAAQAQGWPVTTPADDTARGLPALAKLTGMHCRGGNQVRLLINGDDTFKAILHAIRGAQSLVIVQFFIIRDDRLGRQMQEALLERAAAGVRVYLLFDGVGSHDLPRAYIDRLRAGGVHARAFRAREGWGRRFQLNFRNHRKIVVVDGTCAFVGGHNVGNEYLGKKPPLAPWRDTHVEVRGPAVVDLQLTFSEDWYWATRHLPELILQPQQQAGSMHCQVIAGGPADRLETTQLFFLEAIGQAQRRIWITSPYYVPDEAIDAALRLAVLRGVDVRLLLPSRPDHRVVYAASSLYALGAVAAGIGVYRYQPGFLHQKVLLVDDELAAIGSANLDNRSLRLNFEVMLVTVDRPFASSVEQMLRADFAQARRLTLDDARVTFAQRLWMRMTGLFAPIL
ncbi:MAG: cardiolipin synthase [Pseudomonas sp. PGPPP3]|nr:MAG: cardiolipin synthase [Pseudomonas sp. PGPPP3]